MPPATNHRTPIAEAIAAFASQPLRAAATTFFNTLGYASERTLNFGSLSDFLGTFDREHKRLERFNPIASWNEVQLIFQLTSADIAKGTSHQLSLLEAAPADLRQIDSYLFLAIDLRAPVEGKPSTRSQLCDLARAINRLFPMPVLVLFKGGDKLSIAITYQPCQGVKLQQGRYLSDPVGKDDTMSETSKIECTDSVRNPVACPAGQASLLQELAPA